MLKGYSTYRWLQVGLGLIFVQYIRSETVCDLPEPFPNGKILELESTNSTELPYNSELTYVCDKGYRLEGGGSWRLCKTHGWSGVTPYCAGGNFACHGDRGGPLMQSQLNEEGYAYWTQVGIVSWGIGCDFDNTFYFYTHMSNPRSWIEKQISGDNETCRADVGDLMIVSQLREEGYLDWTKARIVSWCNFCGLSNNYSGFYCHESNIRAWIDQQITDSLAMQ